MIGRRGRVRAHVVIPIGRYLWAWDISAADDCAVCTACGEILDGINTSADDFFEVDVSRLLRHQDGCRAPGGGPGGFTLRT